MEFKNQRRSLLSSQARIQAPWIKVTIGSYTFGVFNRKRKGENKDDNGFYKLYDIQYPNYIQSLSISKVNGQVNKYTLNISYPVRSTDDPNFFEKVFSSVSDTRKIIFSYGDSANPSYIYKDEEALITGITQTFDLNSSRINYQVSAVSSAALATSGSYSFASNNTKRKPSAIIKDLFKNPAYHLQDIFTGMSVRDLDTFIDGGDAAVEIDPKDHISILDYIIYLVSCMIPAGTTTKSNISNDIFILTIHDDTSYDQAFSGEMHGGPYFKVTRTSYKSEQSDAFEIDVGYNTSTLVSNFSIDKNENYSIFYDYQKEIHPQDFIQRINRDGKWEDKYAPTSTSNGKINTDADDITWWTKITKYPINASITIQGLLRPAMLMTYVRLNVIFPGGHKHISSGLYIVTSQRDTIDGNGYKTTLGLTKISGDNYISTNPSNNN